MHDYPLPFSLSSEAIQNPEADWRALRPGVTLRLLFQDPNSTYHIGLVNYQPGASVPMHEHTADEHVYVLSGAQQDERGVYPAGSYVYNPKGSRHSVSSPDGCTVLIHWHAPVRFID